MKLLRPLAAVFLVALSSACGGRDAAGTSTATAGEPGRVIEVNGRRLYFECSGRGRPTVILEAGLDVDHRAWELVQPVVARTTRVCGYDRAGVGLSAGPAERRTALDEVTDLKALLTRAGVDGPYVVVGSSYGGLLAHLFASRHEREVVGVVLVDSSHPDQIERLLEVVPPTANRESEAVSELRNSLLHADGTPHRENVDVPASLAEARRAGPLGDVPLVVVTAGKPWRSLPPQLATRLARTWLDLQRDLARLSTDSIHVVATTSPHQVVSADGRPDVVARAIREVVRAARTRHRLPPCRVVFRKADERCIER